MSTTYKTRKNDTFESISRYSYGIETKASLIKNANPDLIGPPFIEGTIIAIPSDPDAIPKKNFLTNSLNQNEVSIVVDSVKFTFWTSIRINKQMDAMDAVQFIAPFEPENKNITNVLKPFSYKKIQIFVGNDLLFTGTLIAIDPNLNSQTITVSVSCYSTPGVLSDCTLPFNSKFEFDDLSLSDIAKQVCQPFGIGVQTIGDQGLKFEREEITPYEFPLNFLSKLASQREFVIGSSPEGKLLVQKAKKSGEIVAKIAQGQAPLVSINAKFNPQTYYSSITAVETIWSRLFTDPIVKKNPKLTGVIRPFTFLVKDGDPEKALNTKFGRMFANAVAYDLTVATWRDINNKLWQPNTLITVIAPGVMIYNTTQFLIRTVSFFKNIKSETATLNIVPLGSFTGEIKGKLPWEN